jgi:hypothetical protein
MENYVNFCGSKSESFDKTDLDLDSWKDLGSKIWDVQAFIFRMNSSFRKLPKRIKRINKLFLLLKSELDNQVSSEYADSSVKKIFFGFKDNSV